MADTNSDSGSEATFAQDDQSGFTDLVSVPSLTEDEQIEALAASKLQSCVRTFIIRTRLLKKLRGRFEKIYDPTRKRYYYYDTKTDTSGWKKPRLFLSSDIEELSPLFTEEAAAAKIQSRARMMLALLRVRIQYQSTIEKYLDEDSGSEFFLNPRTGNAMWELPQFMAGKLDYKRKDVKPTKTGDRRRTATSKAKKSITKDGAVGVDANDKGVDSGAIDEQKSDAGSDADADATVSDESGLSDDSEAIREKRKAKRRYPRSKAQRAVDAAEDAISNSNSSSEGLLQSLDLSALNAVRVSSRLYDLVELSDLNLSDNQLFRVSPSIQYLVNLKRLNLHSNRLKTLPKELEELQELQELDISDNMMDSYPGNIYKLVNMRKLVLAGNKFAQIPVETGNLELLQELGEWEVGINLLAASLQHLDVSRCRLTAWPDKIHSLEALEYLNLSHNSIDAVPASIESLQQLKFLYLSHNRIVSVPLQIYSLPILEVLSLEHNLLSDIPQHAEPALLSMPSLTELNLSYNALSALDDRLGIFCGLKRLDLSHNRISAFTGESMSLLTALTHCDVSHNSLSDFSRGVAHCTLLTHFDASHNQLLQVPAELVNAPKLLHMNLSHNRITEPSGKVYAMLNDLKRLELQHNAINHIPQLLYSLRKLVYWDMSFNKIASVADSISSMQALEYLNLSHNNLTSLPASLGDVAALRELELEYNELQALPQSILQLRHLHRVTVNNNDLKATPALLETLPLIISMNLAWNPDLEGHQIDWVRRADAFNAKKDFILLPVLKRKVQQAKDRLDRAIKSEKRTPTPYAAAATAAALAAEEASSALVETQQQQKLPSSVKRSTAVTAASDAASLVSQTSKKKSTKKNPKKQEEARKKTLQVLKWHDKLIAHLAKQGMFGDDSFLSISPADAAADVFSFSGSVRTSVKVSSAALSSAAAATEGSVAATAAVSLDSATQQVVQSTQEAVKSRMLQNLSVLIRSCDALRGLPVSWTSQLQCILRGHDFDESILDSVDLGSRFQTSIEQFVYLLNEIDVLAFIAEVRFHLQTEALKNLRAAEARGELQLDRKPNAQALAKAKELVMPQQQQLSTSRQVTPRGRNKSEIEAAQLTIDGDLDVPSDIPPLLQRIPSQRLLRAAEQLPNAPSAAVARITKPSLSISLSRIPYLAHFTRALDGRRCNTSDHNNSEAIVAILFDCLLDLGKALLMRADCFRDSIRVLEVRSCARSSCLDIAQRRGGDDLIDLFPDIYEQLVDEAAVRAATAAKKRIFGTKAAREMDLGEDIFAQDDESTNNAEEERNDKTTIAADERSVHINASKHSKIGKKQKNKHGRKDGKVNETAAASTDVPLTSLLPPMEATVEPSLPRSAGEAAVSFLRAHRLLTLLWASNCFEVASSILKSRGWDPQYEKFRLHATNTHCDEPQWLSQGAPRFAQLRGRLFQALGMYGKSMEEYRNYTRLSKGLRVRSVFINLLKLQLASGNFFEAEHTVYDTIRALYAHHFPGNDLHVASAMPAPLDLVLIDKELALLYRYAVANVAVLRATELFDSHHSRLHSQQQNGLLSCQKYVPPETQRGRSLQHASLLKVRQQQQQRDHAAYEAQQSRNAVRRRLVESRFKALKLIEETDAEIALHKAVNSTNATTASTTTETAGVEVK